jgi:hypothetical protein
VPRATVARWIRSAEVRRRRNSSAFQGTKEPRTERQQKNSVVEARRQRARRSSQLPGFELSEELHNKVLRLVRVYLREAEKCRDSKAFLAGCVMIGAAFEALLLAFANCYPDEASTSQAAPRRQASVKPLLDWSLAALLAVAKERSWLPSGLSRDDEWDGARAQIGDYGEVLRQIRNLVHPVRYAIDFPRGQITERYLETCFEILYVASDHLLNKIEHSIREAIKQDPEAGA